MELLQLVALSPPPAPATRRAAEQAAALGGSVELLAREGAVVACEGCHAMLVTPRWPAMVRAVAVAVSRVSAVAKAVRAVVAGERQPVRKKKGERKEKKKKYKDFLIKLLKI